MEWLVKNALSRDVEREHLNKILKEIRGEIDNVSTSTNTPAPITYITQNNITQGLSAVTVVLQGDVSGEGTTDEDGRLVLTTLISGDIVTPPPDGHEAYWWQDGQWTMIPQSILNLVTVEPAGFTVLDEDYNWAVRTIEGTTEQIVVANGDGLTGNPIVSLADLPNSGVGTGPVKIYTRDSKGRVSGDEDATTDNLPEGITNLYFTDERAQDATGLAIAAGTGDGASLSYNDIGNAINITNTDKGSTAVAAHVAEPDPHPQYALPAGTDAQFYRGDKTLANYVSESLGAGGDWAGDISLVSGGRTLWAQGDTTARFACYSAKDAGAGSQFIGARSGGTMAAPTPPGSATTLFELYGSSYIGPGWAYPAALYFYTTEAHSTTARGTRIQFSTTLQGTTSLVTQLHIGNAGMRATEPGGNNTHILGSSSLRWMEIHGRDYHQYGARLETGVVSPAQLAADTANWAITGLGTAAVVRASTNASRTVSGIASPTAGQTVLLCNVGSFDLILAHDTTSTAANRFLCPGSVNFTLNPNDSVRLWYDTVSARWRVIGV